MELNNLPDFERGECFSCLEQQYALPILCVASFLGHLLSLPLHLSLADAVSTADARGAAKDWAAVMSSLLISAAFSILVMLVGFRAGRKVRLGWPLLAGLGQTPVDFARATRATLLGIFMGFLASCHVLVLDAIVGSKLTVTNVPNPSPLLLSMASVGAAINEEILCRLGFMTILVWMMTSISLRRELGTTIMWVGIILSSLGFAVLHLPQAITFYGKPTIPLMMVVFAGNGIPGILFGWLFWKKGIVAAMVAHFTADILIYGLLPVMGY